MKENELKLIFASSCIEDVASKFNQPANEVYLRFKKIGLIDNYIWEFYDVLHTMSREVVTEDIIRTLHKWESKKKLNV